MHSTNTKPASNYSSLLPTGYSLVPTTNLSPMHVRNDSNLEKYLAAILQLQSEQYCITRKIALVELSRPWLWIYKNKAKALATNYLRRAIINSFGVETSDWN